MTEFVTAQDGVRIAYETAGEGDAVVLVHGFAASRVQNWKNPGWYDTLTGAGYRVVAMDCRGHGDSDKPHDPSFYDHTIMAEDVVAVMEAAHVGANAFLMGYSMGAFISMHVLMDHPDLLGKVVFGGVGATYLERNFSRDAIAKALLEPDKTKITDPVQRRFREFAEQTGKDIKALAACMRGNRRPFTAAELSQSQRPVLVVAGGKDDLAGSPDPLAAAFGDGRAVTVANRDHMTTVGDKVYKQAVIDFFKNMRAGQERA